MSVYSEISKEIGWNGQAITIPTKECAQSLLHAVMDGNADGFREVFRCRRYCMNPFNEETEEAMNIIEDAFRIGCEKFKQS